MGFSLNEILFKEDSVQRAGYCQPPTRDHLGFNSLIIYTKSSHGLKAQILNLDLGQDLIKRINQGVLSQRDYSVKRILNQRSFLIRGVC